VALLEKLADAMPDDWEVRRSLSISYENSARALFLSGQGTAALEFNGKALEVRARLAAEAPTNADFRRMLAISYQNDGDFRDLSSDPRGGLASFRRKLVIDEELLAADPANAQAHGDLAYSSQRLGDILTTLGNHAEALEHYRRSAEEFDRTPREDLGGRLRLVLSHAGIARMEARLGNRSAALASADRAVMIVSETADDPADAAQRGTRAQAYGYLAEAHAALAVSRHTPPGEVRRHWSAARDLFQRSGDIWQDMRRRRILTAIDARKPEAVAREVARCDAMLARGRADSP
jgi:tetratricopeptide (TPR) repeat protein